MMVQPLAKTKIKRHKAKQVPESVMKIVRERSGGICEHCGQNKATDAHHIKLKSQGGLDIAINILHVCRVCHQHSNIDFLHKAKEILRDRINNCFDDYMFYSPGSIAWKLNMEHEEVIKQTRKGFLKTSHPLIPCMASKDDIKRWWGCMNDKNNYTVSASKS